MEMLLVPQAMMPAIALVERTINRLSAHNRRATRMTAVRIAETITSLDKLQRIEITFAFRAS